MARSKTGTFITEIRLDLTPLQAKKFHARFEAGRQVYNACLGEALKRRDLLTQSKAYCHARKLTNAQERREAFKQSRQSVPKGKEFSEYDLLKWATQFTKSWINQHIGARTVEAIATRAFRAVEQSLYGKRGMPRFRKFGEFNTLEGKNGSCVRWKQDHIEWKGLDIKTIVPENDAVIAHGLSSRIKHVNLTRRMEFGEDRYYAHLVCEGIPYRKEKHIVGAGTVGLDIGPSTIAAVGEGKAFLRRFCDELESIERQIRIVQRKLDRQRRANNPENYNENGTIKPRKERKKWQSSFRQKKTGDTLRELHRKHAAYRKNLHRALIHLVFGMGDAVNMEKLSYKSFQMIFGKSVGKRAPGMFVSQLKTMAEKYGVSVNEFDTRTTKLSQVCHNCGRQVKKSLSQRWHRCGCGVEMQRDLYSAFLAKFVEKNKLNTDHAREAWPGTCATLRAVLSELETASGRQQPTSFGLNKARSQSSSSVESKLKKTKSVDVVTEAEQADGESRTEVFGASKTTKYGQSQCFGENCCE